MENANAPVEDKEISCINCTYQEGLDCSLGREEEFTDGKDCSEYIPWWKA